MTDKRKQGSVASPFTVQGANTKMEQRHRMLPAGGSKGSTVAGQLPPAPMPKKLPQPSVSYVPPVGTRRALAPKPVLAPTGPQFNVIARAQPAPYVPAAANGLTPDRGRADLGPLVGLTAGGASWKKLLLGFLVGGVIAYLTSKKTG